MRKIIIFLAVFTLIAISAGGLIWYNRQKTDDSAIITLYPSSDPIKIRAKKPKNSPKIYGNVYENIKKNAKHPKLVKLLPPAEQPILSIENSLNKEISDPLELIDRLILDTVKPTQNSTLNIDTTVNNSQALNPNTTEQSKTNGLYIQFAESNIIPDFWDNITKPYSGYRIQLGAFSTEEEAYKNWSFLQEKYENFLSELHPIIKIIEHSNHSFFYLLLAGDFDNLNKAKSICAKLQSQQQECLVYIEN